MSTNNLKFQAANGSIYDVCVVHAEGQEGTLLIDKLTGVIVTPIMERPEWAEGLAVALLSEHRQFYLSRTGGTYKEPELFNILDLGFVGVNEQGEEHEYSADTEYRMDYLERIYGLDREEGDLGAAVAEVEIAMDYWRTDEEVHGLADAGAELSERTGT